MGRGPALASSTLAAPGCSHTGMSRLCLQELLQAGPEDSGHERFSMWVPETLLPGHAGQGQRGGQEGASSRQFAAVCDDHLLFGLPILAALGLNLPQHIQAFSNLPEHHMLAI